MNTPLLRINDNSYVTLEEADVYVSEHFISTSPEYTSWFNTSLSQEDKIRSLIASAKAINNLRYRGRKKVAGQKLAFPRTYNSRPGYVYLPFVSQFQDSTLIDGAIAGDGYERAKEAQIVNAVYNLSLSPELISDVTERTVQGIIASRVGSGSEAYQPSMQRSGNLMKGIYNQDRVYEILKPWMTDSVYSL